MNRREKVAVGHFKYTNKHGGPRRNLSDADVAGYASMKKAQAEKVWRANLAEQEKRGYDGRPYLRKWSEQRGTSSN